MPNLRQFPFPSDSLTLNFFCLNKFAMRSDLRVCNVIAFAVFKFSVVGLSHFSDPKVLCFSEQCNTKEIYGTE